jgi:hypothetical protein
VAGIERGLQKQQTRLEKLETVNKFIERQHTKQEMKEASTRYKQQINKNHEPDLFSEKINQFKVRDYSNNTRMNIKNHNYS